MNNFKKFFFENLSTILYYALMLVITASLSMDLKSAKAELKAANENLEQHRLYREEVAKVEEFIRTAKPFIPTATRRGFAELTVENGWKIDAMKKEEKK